MYSFVLQGLVKCWPSGVINRLRTSYIYIYNVSHIPFSNSMPTRWWFAVVCCSGFILKYKSLHLDIPPSKIYFDQRKIKFYIGEDVTINAFLENASAEQGVKWHKETENGNNVIDMTLPKYFGITKKSDNHLLVIRDCSELDTGKYYLSTNHGNKKDVFISNTIQLDIIKGKTQNHFFSVLRTFWGKQSPPFINIEILEC